MSKTKKEVMILFASFSYMAMVMERNNGFLPKQIKEPYRKVAFITRYYHHNFENIIDEINRAIASYKTVVIDELLASVAILAHYKEKVKNRSFVPMNWKDLNFIMDSVILDIKDSEKVNATLDFAEFLVDSILQNKIVEKQKSSDALKSIKEKILRDSKINDTPMDDDALWASYKANSKAKKDYKEIK